MARGRKRQASPASDNDLNTSDMDFIDDSDVESDAEGARSACCQSPPTPSLRSALAVHFLWAYVLALRADSNDGDSDYEADEDMEEYDEEAAEAEEVVSEGNEGGAAGEHLREGP